MKTRNMEDLFLPAFFGEDALCVASMKTCNVEDLFRPVAEIEKFLAQQVVSSIFVLFPKCIFFMFHVV